MVFGPFTIQLMASSSTQNSSTIALWSGRLLLPLTLMLLALVLVRCVVAISPELYWDVDPRSAAGAVDVIFMGPTGAAVLDTLSVAVAGASLLLHVLAGGSLRWGSITLAALGAGACVVHLFNDVQNLQRGMSWIAAVCLAIATVHLASRRSLRLWMSAGLVALLVPLLLDSLLYVWIEHPGTVQMFMRDEAEILAARGWEEGSAQHLAYLRRLERPDMTGVFSLSNVFGSVIMAMTVIAGANLVGIVRRDGWWRAMIPAGLVLAGLITVVLSRSRGAAVSLICAALFLAICMSAAWRRWHWRITSLAAVTLVLLAVLTVLLHGLAGPPDTSEGKLISMLFRYQYWQGALGMVMSEAVPRAILGVGPGAFQELYLAHKSSLSPEEVTSAHNLFVDFIAMLGLGGWAWSALLMIWLWQAGRCNPFVGYDVDPDVVRTPSSRPRTSTSRGRVTEIRSSENLRVLLLALSIFGTALVFHLVAITLEFLLVWLFGALAFSLCVTRWVRGVWSAPGWTGFGLFIAATALLMHNQIEMTFFHQGAAVVAWFIVALAAATPAGPNTVNAQQPLSVRRWPRLAVPLAILFGAGVMATSYVKPVRVQQVALREGAVLLRQGDMIGAIDQLGLAIDALPIAPRPYRSRARLLLELAIYEARSGRKDLSRQFLRSALATLDQSTFHGLDRTALIRLRAIVNEQAAEILDEPIRLQTALDDWCRVTTRSPYGLQDHMRLADLQWRLGDFASVGMTYRRCLALSEQAYLDPVRQLSERDRQRIEQRLEQMVNKGVGASS